MFKALTHYRSEAAPEAPGTGLRGTFATGRDECGSVGNATPWVFRAHPGGSGGNGWAEALLLGPALSGNRAVMDSDGG